MVGSLYIVAGAKSAAPEENKTSSVKKKTKAATKKTPAKKKKTETPAKAPQAEKKTETLTEAPKAEEKKAEAPVETPKAEEKTEAAAEAPKTETPVEAPKAEEKKAEATAEAPKAEAEGTIQISDANHLKKVLKENDFDLNRARSEDTGIPRTYMANFPQDMPKIKDHKTKKDLFISTLLPMILRENETILRERKHLLELKKAADTGRSLKPYEQFWLNKICQKYKMSKLDFDELVRRVDIIPPSLALGQAVIESGTGTSYAAVKKHSPFGITVKKSVLKYKDLSESTCAYMRNLNSHAAYRTMRKTREKLRKENKAIDGNALIGDMVAYCEFKNYIGKVRSAIKHNDLVKYDGLNLAPKSAA